MASLNKHGDFYILDFTWHRKAYCQDGKILTNSGDGWRITAKLKPGVTFEQAYKHQLAQRDIVLDKRPCLAELRRRVHAATKSWERRGMLKVAVEMLYDDPDGLWSELQDGYNTPKLSIDECVKICTAYKNAIDEGKAMRGEK